MAIITERGSGKTKTRGDSDSDTAVRIFDVVSTGDVNTEDDAMDAVASSAPAISFGDPVGVKVGSQYRSAAEGAYLYCKIVAARYITVGYYEVACNFSVGNYVPPTNPLKQPWKYGWKTVTIEPPFDRDINGNPILNSSRCPFSTNPTKRISYKSLRVRRFEAFYNYALYKTYENTVNSDTLQLLQPDGSYSYFYPGTAFCVSIEPSGEYTQADNWLEMQLNFEMWDLSLLPSSQTDPFQLQVLDQGQMGFWNNAGVITKGNLCTSAGSPVSSDQQLNSFGLPVETSLTVDGNAPVAFSSMPPAGATVISPTSAAYYLKYKRYVSVPFIPLLSETPQP